MTYRILLDVSKGAKVASFQLTLDSGFGPETGQWELLRRPSDSWKSPSSSGSLSIEPTSSVIGPTFPLPIGAWSRGDLWAAADVRRWARSYESGAAGWGKR